MICRNAGAQGHGDDIVGGVTCGGQSSAPLTRFVDGCNVAHPVRDFLSLHGLQPHLTRREREREKQSGRVTVTLVKGSHIDLTVKSSTDSSERDNRHGG